MFIDVLMASLSRLRDEFSSSLGWSIMRGNVASGEMGIKLHGQSASPEMGDDSRKM